jgi:pimeloyl-ACP methyl ester carboxylesterase
LSLPLLWRLVWRCDVGAAMLGSVSVETTTIEVNGLAFTADVGGPADGELVLLLHGFPQTRHTWRAEVRELAGRGYRVCAPDQRGYSPGARPDGIDQYGIELLVADVIGLADAIGADRFHLVGHDWGGHLAWVTAAVHPDRVRSLAVLSRPHPAAFAAAMSTDAAQSGRSRHHRAFLRPEATDELLVDDAAPLRRRLVASGVPAADADAYLATLGTHAALDAAINWYRAAGRSGLAAADVPSVSAPTLYVWGTDDESVGRTAAEGTAARVQGRYRFVELDIRSLARTLTSLLITRLGPISIILSPVSLQASRTSG